MSSQHAVKYCVRCFKVVIYGLCIELVARNSEEIFVLLVFLIIFGLEDMEFDFVMLQVQEHLGQTEVCGALVVH